MSKTKSEMPATEIASTNAATASAQLPTNVILYCKPEPVAMATRLSELQAQREAWEIKVFKNSNDALYKLLAQCHRIHINLTHTERTELNEYCVANGISFNENTESVTKIVRSVFGVDRRRISTYVLVLRAAREQAVSAAGFTAWITNEGGVQEIRLRRSPNYRSTGERASIARNTVFNQPVLATIKSPVLYNKFLADKGDTVVLIATSNPDGTFSVHQLVQASGAVNAVLSSCYTDVVKTSAAAQPAKDAVNKAEQQHAATRQVANALAQGVAA